MAKTVQPPDPQIGQSKLRKLCAAKYESEAAAEWVYQAVLKEGTVDQILSGERVLPHPIDVANNREREIIEEAKRRAREEE